MIAIKSEKVPASPEGRLVVWAEISTRGWRMCWLMCYEAPPEARMTRNIGSTRPNWWTKWNSNISDRVCSKAATGVLQWISHWKSRMKFEVRRKEGGQ